MSDSVDQQAKETCQLPGLLRSRARDFAALIQEMANVHDVSSAHDLPQTRCC